MLRRVVAIVVAGVLLSAVPSGAADTVPDELAAAASALNAATSWRSVTIMGKGTTIIEFVKPDRTHLILDGREIIRIGPNVWFKKETGWEQVSSSGAGRIPQLTNVGLPPDLVVRRLADESDGTGPAHVYLVAGSSGDPPLHWFVRVSDGRVHKIVGPGGSGLTKSMTIDDYNARISIEPPK